MANRRCLLNLTKHLSSLSSTPSFPHQLHPIPSPPNLLPALSKPLPPFHSLLLSRHFSPNHHSSEDDDFVDDDDDDDDAESEDDEGDALKSPQEIAEKAADIGYKVVGPLQDSENTYRDYEPVFAVVKVGSHQFKVSNGDTITTEKLKYCDVNDKLILNKVLMLGSRTQTLIGRPILPDASVHAVVEEHALDAKVIIFKKKRRKNYRRKNGHRQELTRLRIIDIQGIEKPKTPEPKEKVKSAPEKVEKVAVAA